MLRRSQPGAGRFLAIPGPRPHAGDRATWGGRWQETVEGSRLGAKMPGGFEARVCGRRGGRQPGAAGTEARVQLVAVGRCGSQKLAKATLGCPNLHEMERTPSLGITDQFPMAAGGPLARESRFLPCWQRQGRHAAGLGPGGVSCLSFPSPERGAEQRQLTRTPGRSPATRIERHSRCRLSCRSLLRTRVADGKGNKVKPKLKPGG